MSEFSFNDPLVIALIASLPLGAFAATLGCIVLWRSMAYYGDAMAHAALLGVGFSFVLPQMPLFIAILLVVLAASLLTQYVADRLPVISPNALIGIIAYSALAFGVLLLNAQGQGATDIHHWLLGDLLTLTFEDAVLSALLSIIGLDIIARFWRGFAFLSLHAALARVEGVPVQRLKLVFTFLLSMLIAFAAPVMGVLLITALLILPAAIARLMAKTPGGMGVLAVAASSLSIIAGLAFAFGADYPLAPSIIAASSLLFAITALLRR